MPSKATSSNRNDTNSTKTRLGLTVKKDIVLLRSALARNPWQLKDECWRSVVADWNENYDTPVTIRTVRNRVDLLLEKLSSQQLDFKTGTEEERTERGSLLEEISAIVEEEKVAVNKQHGADNVVDNPEGDIFEEAEVDNATKAVAKTRKKEKMDADADAERLKLLEDEAPVPVSNRPKRQRLSIEDEMIIKRQDHEMETDKLKLEQERLELEAKREERLREEGRRRDDLAASQVQIQTQLLQLLTKVLEK